MSGDIYYQSVTLLIEGSGADNGTTILDTAPTPKTISKFGDVKTSTAVNNPFGGNTGVLAFDGTGDYLSIANHADFNFAAGDFTVECWYYRKTSADYQNIISRWATNQLQFLLACSTTGGLILAISTNGTTQINAVIAGTVALNTWTHVAIWRTGGNIKLAVGGIVVGSYSIGTTALFNSSAVLEIGELDGGTIYPINGYVYDVRVTKGLARYTANFTPPSASFPAYIAYTGTESGTESGSDTFTASGGQLITGTEVGTESGSDTFTASGMLLIVGTEVGTESGSDTFTASGMLLIVGTEVGTESGSDTFTASGMLLIAGTMAVTEPNSDVFMAVYTSLITGTMAATEPDSDTFTASGVQLITGTEAGTESGSDAFTASGMLLITGIIAVTESDSDALAGAGTVFWHVFLSTPPTVEPAVITLFGSEGAAETLTPAANLYSTPASYSSVVVDINTSETPKSGTY